VQYFYKEEMLYDATVSGISRGIGSGFENSLNGRGFGEGFEAGLTSGLIGGASQSIGKIALLGRANPPSDAKTKQALSNAEADMANQGKSVGNYKPTFRTGGLYKRFGPKDWYGKPRGIALGSNALVGEAKQHDYLHEMAHTYQMQKNGYGAFLSKGAFEQWFMNNAYTTTGTNEFNANSFMKLYLIQ
jgi:hypothetical protein